MDLNWPLQYGLQLGQLQDSLYEFLETPLLLCHKEKCGRQAPITLKLRFLMATPPQLQNFVSKLRLTLWKEEQNTTALGCGSEAFWVNHVHFGHYLVTLRTDLFQ